MGQGNINKKLAKEILFELKEIFDSNKVKFFLAFGTCLGAIREKDFIDNDDDIDLGFFENADFNKLKKEFVEKGYKLYPHNLKGAELSLVKEGLKIDLAKYYKSKDIYYCYSFNSKCIVVLPKENLYILKEIEFLGSKFLVPSLVEKYLEYTYTKSWKEKKPLYQMWVHTPNLIKKETKEEVEKYIEEGKFIIQPKERGEF